MAITNLSLEEAIEGLSEVPATEDPEAPIEASPETDQEDAESEADAEEDQEVLEAEAEDDGEPTEADEESEDEEDEEPETYTVKVNGEEEQVTLEQLRSGYMREADYTRKTQAVAEQRKGLDAQAEQISARLVQLEQELEAIDTTLLGTPPAMPPIELLHQDQAAYETQKRGVEEWQILKQNFQTWRQKTVEERAKAQAAKRQTIVETEAKAFADHFQIADRTGFDSKVAEVHKYLMDLGVPQQRLATMIDHFDYVIADKARKYDEMMARAKPKANLKKRKAKVKTAPASARKPVKEKDPASAAQDRFHQVTDRSGPGQNRKDQIDAAVDAFAARG